MMEKITTILQQYSILPQAIVNVTSKVYKIKANGKQYALKHSRLKSNQLKMWTSVYHIANEEKLAIILPVYLTNDKQLYVEMEGEIYYLTPWIEEGNSQLNKESVEKLFKKLAKIHLRTKQVHKLNKNDMEESFLSYQKNCKEYEVKLRSIIELFEQRHYPSPFELQVLTQNRNLSYALQTSQELVDRILSLIEGDSNWGTSLTHGNLKKNHCFEQYIINWEQASFKHAIHDLNHLFQTESEFGFYKSQLLIHSFPVYLEENPLSRLELSLLDLYLLNTQSYFNILEMYQTDRKRNISMVEQTIQLEKAYRNIIFGLEFNEQMDAFNVAATSD